MSEDTLEMDSVATESFIPQSTLNLYPNPANQFIHLDFIEEKWPNALYQIIDINGKIVLENKLQVDIINVGALIPGIYFFRLKIEKTI